MSSHGLTSEELKRQYAAEIAEIASFETHGIRVQAAKYYLDTPEGKLFWQRLVEADPNAPLSDIKDRAIGQITSGRDLPRMEIISEPLVKIVPAGEGVHSKSPSFKIAFEAMTNGHQN